MSDPCKMFKYVYSTILLIFCIVIVMALIFSENTKLAQDVHPALAFIVIWAAVIWLNMVEGGQGALVGLPPIDRDLYRGSHPTTYMNTSLAHKGDNLDRYLIGRQFMVVLIVFVTNLSGAPLEDAEVFGLPDIVSTIFLSSGVAMILMTAMVGQLNSQVNASHCMLDYINNYFSLFTLYVALGIEFSGLLHCVYLVQIVFAQLAGKPIESREPPRSALANLFFWGRVVMSLAILGFAFAVTLSALFNGQTTMWDGVPEAVSVILFFLLMSVVGMLEGMQIAFFAVAKLTEEERSVSPIAMKTCDLLFHGKGRNLSGFMIGRQVCVTLCFFVIARVTTLNIDVDAGDETVFGVSDSLQEFFNTGLLGAIITTAVGSISWQLVASAFPLAFLSNPLVYILLRICLLLEATGICSGAWVLAKIHKRIAGFKYDEVYVGTADERRARKLAAGQVMQSMRVEPGHMYPGVPTLPATLGRQAHTLDEIEELKHDLLEHKQEIQERLRELEEERQRIVKYGQAGAQGQSKVVTNIDVTSAYDEEAGSDDGDGDGDEDPEWKKEATETVMSEILNS